MVHNDKSYDLKRIQINSTKFELDSKRFITITVNDSTIINPSTCYVPSYGQYENLGIIQKKLYFKPFKR